MLENITVFEQNSIRMERGCVIYFDPYGIDRTYHDADFVFITHDHYDHLSAEDLKKVVKRETRFVLPEQADRSALGAEAGAERILFVEPGRKYQIGELEFETVPSYNVAKPFHPRKKNWVGYILTLDGVRYYVAGDTDMTKESREVRCDVAFLPVGGTYTMDYKKAAELANLIRPKVAVPVHYGTIVGKKEDGLRFQEELSDGIRCEILLGRA